MPDAMVLSVGGSPQPIIASLSHFKPRFVSLLVSQDSNRDIGHILKIVQDTIGLKIESLVVITTDHQDLGACFDAASRAVGAALTWAQKKSVDPQAVAVDFTGGTKCMSVALGYAAMEHALTFSYVGGTGRTKDGLGIVMDGKEKVFSAVNPWVLLARDEKLKICELFNNCQFAAALSKYRELSTKTVEFKSFHDRFNALLSGYCKWDLFRHVEAVKDFSKADTATMLDLKGSDNAEIFIRDSITLYDNLKEIAGKSKSCGGSSYSPTKFHLMDLIGNALRRKKEGKIDDAVLRLYRAVEMAAQIRLADRSIDCSKVLPEQIPEVLREEFIKKYGFQDKTGNMFCKVPQSAALKILAHLNDELGLRYLEKENEFDTIQFQRNYSYLAHGCNSSAGDTLEKLESFVLEITGITENSIIHFPILEL